MNDLPCATCGRPSYARYHAANREMAFAGHRDGCLREGNEMCLLAAVAMWKASAQERAVVLARISGTLCDAADIPSGALPENVAALLAQRDEARKALASVGLDDVCRALRDFAQAEGFQRVQMTVRADGHVFLAATNGPDGDRVWTDTLDGVTPSAALARMRGSRGGVRDVD